MCLCRIHSCSLSIFCFSFSKNVCTSAEYKLYKYCIRCHVVSLANRVRVGDGACRRYPFSSAFWHVSRSRGLVSIKPSQVCVRREQCILSLCHCLKAMWQSPVTPFAFADMCLFASVTTSCVLCCLARPHLPCSLMLILCRLHA